MTRLLTHRATQGGTPGHAREERGTVGTPRDVWGSA